VEYLRNHIFYHRTKGEHPERKKSIKSSNKTTPRKPGVRSIPVCQPAVLILNLDPPTQLLKTMNGIVWMQTMYRLLAFVYLCAGIAGIVVPSLNSAAGTEPCKSLDNQGLPQNEASVRFC